METILNKYAVNQIGYVADDAEAFARTHSALFGSGPYYIMESVTNKDVNYRGKIMDVTMKILMGQYGNLQVEIVQILGENNPYAEMAGGKGFHHFSIWADDYDAAVKEFSDAGCDIAFSFVSGGGLRVAFFDCRELIGHYIEMHAPQDVFWNMIREGSLDWDGQKPVRKLGE